MLVGEHQVLGCDCVLRDVQGSLKTADVVLVGKVTEVRRVDVSDVRTMPFLPVYVLRVEVLIERMVKGKRLNDTVVVYTSEEGAECGVAFRLNERYVIYGDRDPEFVVQLTSATEPLYGRGIYWTNDCMRTRPYEEDEVKALGAFK